MSFSTIRRYFIAAGLVTGLSGLAAPAFAQTSVTQNNASWISFQVPGCPSTFPRSINASLSVTGTISSTTAVKCGPHGFVRNATGGITVFDPPGSAATTPASINDGGVIAGYFQDSAQAQHGFVRTSDGTITVFDAPGGAGSTTVTGINKNGVIAGYYGPVGGPNGGPNGPNHGFVRSAAGKFTSFDPPGSVNTYVADINGEGSVAGNYFATDGTQYGYVRTSAGEFTTFNVPGVGFSFNSYNYRINSAGTVTGSFTTHSDGHPSQGFVRSRQGTITSFDVPGDAPFGGGTAPVDINTSGAITGSFGSGAGQTEGFVRNSQGTFVIFGYPEATISSVASINDSGDVTGSYLNSDGTTETGFIRVPLRNEDGAAFLPGVWDVSDSNNLMLDGGFYLYGDPEVRLWPFVLTNPSQHWKFARVTGGFTMFNQGTGQYASDIGGQLQQGGAADVWTIKPVTGGYTIQNNRTGLFLTEDGVQDDAVILTGTGSVWRFSSAE